MNKSNSFLEGIILEIKDDLVNDFFLEEDISEIISDKKPVKYIDEMVISYLKEIKLYIKVYIEYRIAMMEDSYYTLSKVLLELWKDWGIDDTSMFLVNGMIDKKHSLEKIKIFIVKNIFDIVYSFFQENLSNYLYLQFFKETDIFFSIGDKDSMLWIDLCRKYDLTFSQLKKLSLYYTPEEAERVIKYGEDIDDE